MHSPRFTALRWKMSVFDDLDATRGGVREPRRLRLGELWQTATGSRIHKCIRALVRSKPLVMIPDPPKHGEVVATVRFEGKRNPPNWMMITAHIPFRAHKDIAKAPHPVAHRIRGQAFGDTGVDSTAAVGVIRRGDKVLFFA